MQICKRYHRVPQGKTTDTLGRQEIIIMKATVSINDKPSVTTKLIQMGQLPTV